MHQSQTTDNLRWGRGADPPPPTHTLKNPKAIGFLSVTGLDPLKNHKATKPAFNVGPALETFPWLADDFPLLVVFGYLSPHQLIQKRKTLSELDPPPFKNFLNPHMYAHGGRDSEHVNPDKTDE